MLSLFHQSGIITIRSQAGILVHAPLPKMYEEEFSFLLQQNNQEVWCFNNWWWWFFANLGILILNETFNRKYWWQDSLLMTMDNDNINEQWLLWLSMVAGNCVRLWLWDIFNGDSQNHVDGQFARGQKASGGFAFDCGYKSDGSCKPTVVTIQKSVAIPIMITNQSDCSCNGIGKSIGENLILMAVLSDMMLWICWL